MSKTKMSWEELNVEALRLSVLIDKASEAGIKRVAEMSKQPLTLEQMREQVRRQNAEADHVWKHGRGSDPVSDR